MSKKLIKARKLRMKRKARIRSKVSGSAERPRLTVFKSAKHLSAQVIDDVSGKTLVAVSSFGKEPVRANVEGCAKLGQALADRCKAANVTKVVFDRNGFQFHGRVKAFADGVREGGLSF